MHIVAKTNCCEGYKPRIQTFQKTPVLKVNGDGAYDDELKDNKCARCKKPFRFHMLRLGPFEHNSFCFDHEVCYASGQELPCCFEKHHCNGKTKETADDGETSAELCSGCDIAISYGKQSSQHY